MRLRTSILAGFAFAITPTLASTIIAPTDDPAVTAQMYRDEAALYPMVGKVSGSGLNGSGVLISDRWVLTAGHIAFRRTSGTFNVGGVDYTISRSITHPNYVFGSNPFDLGLLYLSGPVSAVSAASMIQLGGPNSILGREATWVGTGLTGTGLTGAQAPLEFRAFTNVIDVIGTAYGLTETSFVADFDRPDGSTNSDPLLSSPTATRLEGNVASGDSGGGVFITEGGIDYLVGINSYTGRFGPGAASSYGSISGANNLELFHSWILDQTGISAVPEPGSLWILCLASLLGLRRWR
ncbi:MAG: trypsin-like serine protease [Luteolibacter sp.]